MEIGLVSTAGSTDTSEITVGDDAGAAKRDIKPAYFLTNKSIKGLLIDKIKASAFALFMLLSELTVVRCLSKDSLKDVCDACGVQVSEIRP